MSTMLIGRWSDDGSELTIVDSQQVHDGDQEAIDALFENATEREGADWGCAYDVDRHTDAIQRAYEEEARPFGAAVVDEVEGHTPTTF